MTKKKPRKGYGTYYLYKDKFMSGWGPAKRGSYVITDAPVRRPEFKKLGEASGLKI